LSCRGFRRRGSGFSGLRLLVGGLSPFEAVEEAIDLWLRSLGAAGGSVADFAAGDLVWVRMREGLRREARGRCVVIVGG
jgi:hypothetical protein